MSAYIRKSTYAVKDVLKHIGKGPVDFDGDLIPMGSHRYLCFRNSGTVCIKCGLKGVLFAKERCKSDKSKGGKDRVKNYQTMCAKCNEDKGSKTPKPWHFEKAKKVRKHVKESNIGRTDGS